MVFVRFTLLFALACVFSLNEGAAGPKNKEDLSLKNIQTTPQKRKRSETPSKLQNPPLLKKRRKNDSPQTKERKHWGNKREKLALAEHPDGQKRKSNVPSPIARKILMDPRTDSQNAHEELYEQVHFEGRTVFQAKRHFLYDPNATVFTTKGKWETNLERMHKGRAPVSQKGIVKNDADLSLRKILTLQKRYTIELHHLTQKDTGTDEDPIIEMTEASHMGLNARMILEQDPETNNVKVVYVNLEKEDVRERLLPHQFAVTNVLHFRTGRSLIDREDFDPWRVAYWKARAKELESCEGTRRKLFP